MARTVATHQLPVPLIQANLIQATGSKDKGDEVLPEEAVTKYVADKADTSTAPLTNHPSGTSRDKWKILERY